ncbi:putative FBD-associated F-box protein At5g53635 [Pistacia vera]|uniref:putative FBD-associated F-box protein At5g53635 n=1 Tax=Pistacia vera TaxID=55513 RepID=UPI0012639831|nr:putative FBD-associated F-box protein At5g53635 [Pistacia vera]
MVLQRNSKIRKPLIRWKVGAGEDLISKLPDSIILHIFSFLPIKVVLRTSALSTRWKNLWTSISNIDFDECSHYLQLGMKPSFLDSVEKVLHRDPSCIRKFCFRCIMDVSASRINSWISVAVTLKVQELDLSLPHTSCFELPDALFSSDTLKILRLDMRVLFKVPPLKHLSNLKTLRLWSVTFEGDQSTEQILSGCPVLEELDLYRCFWKNTVEVTVSVPTLRTLEISSLLSLCLFRIYAENLISLKLQKLFTSSSFTIYGYKKKECAQRAIKLIGGAHNVETLTLSNDILECLSFEENLHTCLPTFHTLAHLKVISCNYGHTNGALMNFLLKSPIVESLEIPSVFHRDNRLLLNIVPQCLKSCLKTVIIAFFEGYVREVTFLKYFLKNANMLERVTIFCTRNYSTNLEKQNNVYHELQAIRRCVIEFRYSWTRRERYW